MSVAARLISGSAASWAQIAVTMVSQLALVPIYLSHWTITTYGVWLAIQSLVGVMSTLGVGHQEFMAYEFLRLGQKDRPALAKAIWSGVGVTLIIGVVEIFLIVAFIVTGVLPLFLEKMVGANLTLMKDASFILLIQGFTGLIVTSTAGLLARALFPFGYFPRMAWWSLVGSIVTSLAPALAVIWGADLLVTSLAAVGATMVVSGGLYLDIWSLLRKEKIHFCVPSLRLGYQNFLRSLAISGRVLLESSRQQGVRLIIAPLSTAAGLAAFSTMRTGANVALQGLNTIVNPLMPELTRFLHQRDQQRSEAALGMVWFVLIAVMAPATVALQVVIEPLYKVWTQGKVPFNPQLFAVLSLSVLVYAAMQPAMAVVRGFNLLRAQLLLSTLTAVIVVVGMCLLVPALGILGGGIALLLAEIGTAIGYRMVALRCFHQKGLAWPGHHFHLATISVGIAALAMGIIIYFPQAQWLTLAVAFLLFFLNLWRYWQVLPLLATYRAKQMIIALPYVKRFFVA